MAQGRKGEEIILESKVREYLLSGGTGGSSVQFFTFKGFKEWARGISFSYSELGTVLTVLVIEQVLRVGVNIGGDFFLISIDS